MFVCLFVCINMRVCTGLCLGHSWAEEFMKDHPTAGKGEESNVWVCGCVGG